MENPFPHLAISGIRCGMDIEIRPAREEDVSPIAALWHQGWQDGHAEIVPAALTALRTAESFPERVAKRLGAVWIAEADGALLGFYMLSGAELYQFYLASEARGTGLAGRLMADAEARLAGDGVEVAWLACSVGNLRAARFYEKTGWRNMGVRREDVETSAGAFGLDVWRFEKVLASGDGS